MKRHFELLVFVISIIFCFSCTKEDDGNQEYRAINEWISNKMHIFYLWNDHIQVSASDLHLKPEEYFDQFIYHEKDRWSIITDDFQALMASLDGNPLSTGINPMFATINNSEKIIIIVIFVYKNSPAERAGFKRGDIISKINDIELTKENYRGLFYSDSFEATLSNFDESFTEIKNVNIEAKQLTIDPFVFDTVYHSSNNKIGYLFLSEFTGIENFKRNFQQAYFRLGDIDHLILDLRYNRGGSLAAAQWIASALVPNTINENQLLIKLRYNDNVQPLLEPEQINYPFINSGFSFKLQDITFLTTSNTASASELLITGLNPYMNVVQVGTSTHGKYTAAMPFADDNIPPLHNYGILPIVAKYENSIGYTDFSEGLTPNHEIEDYLLETHPLGSLNDPIIAKAYALITGEGKNKMEIKKEVSYQIQTFKSQQQKGLSNLIID